MKWPAICSVPYKMFMRYQSIHFATISNLVEDKISFLLGKNLFSMGWENRVFPFWHRSPMPRQKDIRLAKKGGGSSDSRCGLLRFVVEPSLSPRVTLRKGRGKKD